MECGNTSDFIDQPLSKHFVSAHGASHRAWASSPHHLNPTLTQVNFIFVMYRSPANFQFSFFSAET